MKAVVQDIFPICAPERTSLLKNHLLYISSIPAFVPHTIRSKTLQNEQPCSGDFLRAGQTFRCVHGNSWLRQLGQVSGSEGMLQGSSHGCKTLS